MKKIIKRTGETITATETKDNKVFYEKGGNKYFEFSKDVEDLEKDRLVFKITFRASIKNDWSDEEWGEIQNEIFCALEEHSINITLPNGKTEEVILEALYHPEKVYLPNP